MLNVRLIPKCGVTVVSRPLICCIKHVLKHLLMCLAVMNSCEKHTFPQYEDREA